MKNSSVHCKKSFRLLDFDRRLNMYVLAASAAGVGMLALAPPAESEIIYTKAHIAIAPKTTLHLDLNHDGIADFDLRDTFSTSFYSAWGRLTALPDQQKNQIWGHTVSRRAYASALFAGARVGPEGQFLPASGLMASTYFLGGKRHPAQSVVYCKDPWAGVSARYLGLKFVITGKVHFGWARLNVTCSNTQASALLTGYAYETVPDRPIVTGQEKGPENDISSQPSPDSPTGLGRLAQGATGLSAGQRRQ